ncbi:hypothetical protein J6590_058750 [Homalodisca vitripennis]|nr:hypothetical protein J6590_058750 [Homalodisca vitripennis]
MTPVASGQIRQAVSMCEYRRHMTCVEEDAGIPHKWWCQQSSGIWPDTAGSEYAHDVRGRRCGGSHISGGVNSPVASGQIRQAVSMCEYRRHMTCVEEDAGIPHKWRCQQSSGIWPDTAGSEYVRVSQSHDVRGGRCGGSHISGGVNSPVASGQIQQAVEHCVNESEESFGLGCAAPDQPAQYRTSPLFAESRIGDSGSILWSSLLPQFGFLIDSQLF